jgi:hypothetical protein
MTRAEKSPEIRAGEAGGGGFPGFSGLLLALERDFR